MVDHRSAAADSKSYDGDLRMVDSSSISVHGALARRTDDEDPSSRRCQGGRAGLAERDAATQFVA